MVLILKRSADKETIQKSLQKIAKKGKSGGFNANLFLGKLKRGLNGVKYQTQLRDEWN